MIPKAFNPFLGLSDNFTEQDYYAVTELYRDLAKELVRKIPQSRELSLALTKLEESLYFARTGMLDSMVSLTEMDPN